MPVKQSFCLPMYRSKDLSLASLFKQVKTIGYAAVELWARGEDYDEIVARAREAGLVVASMAGHDSLGDGLNQRSNHDRIEEELKRSIDIAARDHVPGLICFSGNRQPFQSDLEAIDAVADGLKRVAPYAETKGINLNLELLNSKVDHAGYQADHTAWGVAVCEKVGSPRAKLLFDIYHMQIMEGDLIRTIRANAKWMGHFHTAGNPGRKDMDDSQELNYTGICRAIAETGYSLYVGHEFSPKGDVVEALRKAFAICNA